ncbi:hypothetical protein DENSPDRAFT_933847 [Dentipellis sp. KUC8613]|nr:hypothetical protein DENSPDRAFT_933847 [Dentipellis sp. KUC8613]
MSLAMPTVSRESVPAVLTIAGSDPSGGAGIQADLKTFTALGCYGTSVITALTAQNTVGVQGVHGVPPEFVEQQLRSVVSDIPLKAIKTGMLYSAPVAHAAVEALRALYASAATPIPPLVVDPVCVSTSGHTLLQPDAVDVLISELFPLAALITPNKSEAELLLERLAASPSSAIVTSTPAPTTIASLEDMVSAARALLRTGPRAVLVKGGHLTTDMGDVRRVQDGNVHVDTSALLGENMEILLVAERDPAARELVVDVLAEAGPGARTTLFVRPRIESESTHGTGCTLSAALACALARGASYAEAVGKAAEYTHLGIATAFPMGKGHGPLNHMHPTLLRSIPLPTDSNPHPFLRLLIRTNADIWKTYVQHPFVQQLGRGTLARESFIHFIKQDYLYLKYYARAQALLGAKSSTYDGMAAAAETMLHVVRESRMHRSFCEKWGVSAEELDSTPESAACTAYGAFVVDMGLRGDTSRLIMALAACLLGYGEVGLWLAREAARPESERWVVLEGNPYRKWIEDYSGKDYQDAVRAGIERIEKMAQDDPPSPARFEEWRLVWERCTRLEKGFWDMAMDRS